MSFVNYNANTCNHAEILISIQTVGNLPESDFVEALSKIKRHSLVQIADAGRAVNFRFELESSPENSKWGFFQPHRRVMGLIVLASCSSAIEVALLHETFQKQKEAFSDFIFDSRCFVFGIESAFSHQNKAEVFQFMNVESWKCSDDDIKGFLTSVFYVLESKRLQMIADKSDRPPLLTTPFEKNQQNPSDSDSKMFRKKCLGRWKKYLADISLLAGLRIEALQNFNLALDLLTSINDQVWVGAALEGLCVISALTLFGTSNLILTQSIKKDSNKQVLDPRNLVSSLSNSVTTPEAKKLCIQTPSEFVEQYKAAVIYYSRSENMGVVELEACIKATRVMSVLNKHIQAAEFLQNAVYIAMNVSDEERITKYSILANLYADINFHRKSAFYRRVAAMQCVAPHLKQVDWKKCYSLLQGTFEGYGLKLLSYTGLPSELNMSGWPQVQIRVLQELLFSAGKIGKHHAANRYAVYLIMHLHQHFSFVEEKEACSSLMSTQREDTTDSDQEFKFPSIDFYYLPEVRVIAPQPLSEQMELSCLNLSQNNSSVFLFTPSTYHSLHKEHKKFKWCVNTTSCVQMHLYNPLQTQTLHVTNISPIYESKNDAKLYCYKLDVDVPPGKCVLANMMLVPKSEGTIRITGYHATALGVSSSCLLSHMPWISVDYFEIDVVVELPILKRENSCLSPDANNKMMITLYRGETRILEVPFTNSSSVSVHYIDATSLSPILVFNNADKSTARQLARWLTVSCEDVQHQLPIQPGNSLLLPIVMKTKPKLEDLSKETLACSCQVQIKYSSLKGIEENWCRTTAVHLMASLQTCIYVLSMTIRQSVRQGFCVIAVRLSDVSEDDVIVCSLTLTKDDMFNWGDKQAKYEDGSLILAQLKPDDTALIEAQIPMIKMNEPTGADLVDLKQKLSDVLSLQWIIQDDTSSRTGFLDISSCDLDPLSALNCSLQPLLWKMSANQYEVHEEVIECAVGENFPVNVVIKNVSDKVCEVDVDLEVFQDQENGFREWNMEDCVICVGCQNQSFQVSPQEEVCFECSLIFLLCGNYHIRVRRILDTDEHTPEHETRYFPSNYEAINYKRFSPSFVVCVADVS